MIQLVGGGDEENVGDNEEFPDAAVLGICRFTRSLGDCHMKTACSAAAFNQFQATRHTGLEILIAPLHKAAANGFGFISNVAECHSSEVSDGFKIVA